MRVFRHILIIVVTFGLSAAKAQTDTLPGLNLFNNAASDNALQDNINETIQATDSITEQLNTLQELYQIGKYGQALVLARDISNQEHLTKQQNLLRLKYNIAAFKELEFHHEADSTAQLFLQKDPFYKTNSNDPLPFCEVLDNYYTMPKIAVWASAGISTVKPLLDTVRTVVDTINRKPDYIINGYSFQVGFEFRPWKILTVSVAPTFGFYNIDRSINRTKNAVFYYNEDCAILSVPLCLEANIFSGNEIVVPSVYAGAQFRYILSSNYIAYTEAEGVYPERSDLADGIDTKNRINTSVLGGVKLNVNVKRITYFADLGIAYDFRSYNNPAKKYNDAALLYQNLYIPDVFRMLEFSLRVGVKVNLHYKTIAKYNYGY